MKSGQLYHLSPFFSFLLNQQKVSFIKMRGLENFDQQSDKVDSWQAKDTNTSY